MRKPSRQPAPAVPLRRGTPPLACALIAAMLCVCPAISACGTMQNGRKWGQDVTALPGLSRLGRAALGAATDPRTWAPAAGALVFSAGGLDKRVSDWASEHTPVFGSREDAASASDVMVDVAMASAAATALLTPSGDSAGDWAWSKAKGVLVEELALAATVNATGILKNTTRRERPDGSNRQSFPSGHTSTAAACATMARRNTEAMGATGAVGWALDIGFTGLTAATAWARVEAKAHYPSDVLVGAALANFLTTFVCDAFLGDRARGDLSLGFAPTEHGLALVAETRF